MVKGLTIGEVQMIAHTLAMNWMAWDEPIPPFSTRFPAKLESCLAMPFQTVGRQDLYPGLTQKAAILFYLLVKNHPFQNGNKRIAVTSLFVFLHKNRKWLKVDNQELYNFAVWVAESPASVKDQTVEATQIFVRNHLVNL
ncbi:MAG: type II toxin-antitoxin system death-on-curing family toxin [Patescibacteria group bacterium]